MLKSCVGIYKIVYLGMINAETILATDFTQEATVITLTSIPTVQEQNELFGSDESIILEF